MASLLPRRPSCQILTQGALRAQTTPAASVSSSLQISLNQTQTRNATLIKRPRRPYTFTQLVRLTDGSTYTIRTTSPLAMYQTDKDSRNHIMWNPSEASLKNVEADEAGKLAAFRERFGRGFDLDGDLVGQEAESFEAKFDASLKDAAHGKDKKAKRPKRRGMM